MFFERLLDWIDRGWSLLRPFFVVDAYELGAVLRFGVFHRSAQPGIHWKIPFAEQVIDITACVTTVRLPAQPLTTKDDVAVTISAIVKYQITDVEPYVVGIFDQHDVLCDVTMGAIRDTVAKANYTDLLVSPPEAEVLKMVRAEVNRYGFKILKVTFTAFTKARPIMLIQQQVFQNLDN